MKIMVVFLAVLATLGLGATGPAEAVLLTNSNTTELAGVVITVTIGSVASGVGSCTTLGGCTTLSVQLTTNPLVNTALGIDQFGLNQSTAFPVIAPASWLPDATNAQQDSFGKFSDTVADAASTDGISSPVVFTLNGIATFTPNDATHNAQFVAHVRFASATSCSGWVSDGTPGKVESASGCTPVPEPITMFLGGTGLLTLGYAARKRLLGGRIAS